MNSVEFRPKPNKFTIDDSIRDSWDGDHWANYVDIPELGDEITLDGRFTIAQLESIIGQMKTRDAR